MKWLRLSLLLFALIAPLGAANCYADALDDDVPAKPARSEDPDLDNKSILSIVGGFVVIILGVSFIALRRSRKSHGDQIE
jgi:hypothetical protein